MGLWDNLLRTPTRVCATLPGLWLAATAGASVQLAAPVDLTTTVGGPRLLPPADVDGDGDLDVLVTDASGRRLHWIEQTPGGDGRLRLLLESPGTSTLWHVADLDGDGDLDVLAAPRSPAQLYVYERVTGGYLAPRREVGFSGEVLGLDVGDVTRDGLPDVIMGLDGPLPAQRGHFVLPGMGSGRLGWPARFTPGGQVASGIATGPPQLADLDRDGDLDVLVLDRDLQRIVWFRDQGGTFAQGPLVVDDQWLELASVEAADLDGDGRLDLVASGTPSSRDHGQDIAFYRGSSNGAFQPPVALAVHPQREPAPLQLGDVDGDGDLDLLFAADESDRLWLENLSPGFAPKPRALPKHPGWDVRDERFADLNGDGQPERVLACETQQVGWSLGRGAGAFGAPEEVTQRADGAQAAAALDVDEDGDLDLLVAASGVGQVLSLENLGAGSFGSPEHLFDVPEDLEEMLAADLDVDGDRDIVTASFGGGWIHLHALDSGRFSRPLPLLTFAPAPGGTITVADVDGDTLPDLAVSILGEGDVVWFRGGPGAFDPTARVLVRDQPAVADLAIRDVDGDGACDLILTGPGFGGSVGWFPGQGQATFGSRVPIPTINFQPRNVVPIDVDGDGDLDLVVGGAGFVFPLLEWIPQIAPGQFGAPDYVGSAVQGWASIEAADLDLDGDLDLLTTPREGSLEPLALTVYPAPFGAPPVVVERPEGVSSFFVEDIDADGDPDVLLTSERADSVTWLRGTARGFLGTAECLGGAVGAATLEAVGSPWRGDNAFRLRATGLPPAALTLFITSQTPGLIIGPGGSLGALCLGGRIGRFDRPGETQSATSTGVATLDVDLGDVPQPLTTQSVLSGETWRFQAWFRDALGGAATSNFSGSVAVEFR